MFRAALWKEWREQAAIIVALLALGGATMAAAVQFGSPAGDGPIRFYSTAQQTALLAFAMLGLTAGTVIGASLFAGEEEAGTAGFLDTLPATRWRLWRGKVFAGLVLTAGTTAVLLAEGWALGAAGSGTAAAVWAGWIGLLTFAAFGWGAVGSVRAKGTLAACGLGLLASGVAFLFCLAFTGIVLRVFENAYGYRTRNDPLIVLLLATALLIALPLPLSGLLYVAPDWQRAAAALAPIPSKRTRTPVQPTRGGWAGTGLWGLMWLLFRQSLIPVVVLSGVALMAGLIPLAEPVPMFAAWPAATLCLGVLVGVIGWADEQWRGVARYWGEQRLPIRRLWLAKVLVGLGLTFGLAFLFAVPSLIRAAAGAGPSPLYLVYLIGSPPTLGAIVCAFILWPVYGFGAGHLAGMLFRKPVVAAAVGLITAAPLAALWFPSLLGGGLHAWQPLAAPAVALLTALGLMRAWSADRIETRGPLARLATGLTLVLAVTAGGLAYRAFEVPIIPEADDDLKFAKTIPPFEENKAGRDIRSAIGEYGRLGRTLLERKPETPVFPDEREDNQHGLLARAYLNRLPLVSGKCGWPTDRPDLDQWMDEVFEKKDWQESLFVAAGKPLGVIEDVTTHDFGSIFDTKVTALKVWMEMAALMLARGLQLQARGDPAPFIRYLDATLSLSRNARNKAGYVHFQIGQAIEGNAFNALDRWLERLAGRPDLLREALAVLTRHAATVPTSPTDRFLAERVVIRNSVVSPTGWATRRLETETADAVRNRRMSSDRAKNRVDLEVSVLGFAWTVPWEKERLRRIVGLGNQPTQWLQVHHLTRGAPGKFSLAHYTTTPLQDSVELARRRAAILTAALRLFEAETGSPAKALDELVPAYLPAVPADPFDGKQFRYRLSAGETVVMEKLPPQPLAHGSREVVVNGPGFDPISDTQLSHEEFDAVASVGGGVVRFPRPIPPLEEMLVTDEHYDAAASILGGGVQRELPPLIVESSEIAEGAAGGYRPIPYAGPPGGSYSGPMGMAMSLNRAWPVDPFEGFRKVNVAPGQGILWSIGPDRIDEGGKELTQADEWHIQRLYVTKGDLIFIVPLPADKVPPAAKGTK